MDRLLTTFIFVSSTPLSSLRRVSFEIQSSNTIRIVQYNRSIAKPAFNVTQERSREVERNKTAWGAQRLTLIEPQIEALRLQALPSSVFTFAALLRS
jgi:hypothetical protein